MQFEEGSLSKSTHDTTCICGTLHYAELPRSLGLFVEMVTSNFNLKDLQHPSKKYWDRCIHKPIGPL